MAVSQERWHSFDRRSTKANSTVLSPDKSDYRTSLTMSALSNPFVSTLLRSLRRVSSFVVFFGPASMTTARP